MRASGNPLTSEAFLDLVTTMIENNTCKLMSIDNIQILPGEQVAIVVYTTEESFLYQGVPAHDRATFTGVLEIDPHNGGVPKLVHVHRSSGTPVPARWSASEE